MVETNTPINPDNWLPDLTGESEITLYFKDETAVTDGKEGIVISHNITMPASTFVGVYFAFCGMIVSTDGVKFIITQHMYDYANMLAGENAL